MAQQDQTSESWDQKQSSQSAGEGSKQTGEEEGSITFKPKTISCPTDQDGNQTHTFYHTESMAVKCRSCPIGYTLSPGTHLKAGHIYVGDQLLI